jgi:hypothetical protein
MTGLPKIAWIFRQPVRFLRSRAGMKADRSHIARVLLAALVLVCALEAEAGPRGHVKVYTPAEVAEFCYEEGGRTYLAFPGTRRWLLDAGVACHPMPADGVIEAVEAVTYPLDDVRIHILILPLPRHDVPRSSAEGNVIFLSPGGASYPLEHVHYTVTHEIGHVVHNTLMPDSRRDLWTEYSGLRGLSESVSFAGPHASRLHEIFAEDFRVLFGGDLARCGGQVENHEIVSPDEVRGLRDFMLALADEVPGGLVLSAYPNPFETGVVVLADAIDQEAVLDEVLVLDATGRIVRSIVPGPGCDEVMWDGRNHRGQPVSPGVYLVVARAGRTNSVCKMVKTLR